MLYSFLDRLSRKVAHCIVQATHLSSLIVATLSIPVMSDINSLMAGFFLDGIIVVLLSVGTIKHESVGCTFPALGIQSSILI